MILLLLFRDLVYPVSAKDIVRGLVIFGIISLIFFGCLLFNGQVSGDAVNFWLPLSREVVKQSTMPDLLLNVSNFYTSRPPLFPLLSAATFSFFGFNEIFALWIPFLFSLLTFLLLRKWCKFKNISSKYTNFLLILFITSSMVLTWGWELLQESLILFFFVAFFYYFEKYKKERTKLNFLLLLFSFILAVASKEGGMILVIPLVFILFKKEWWKGIKKYLIPITALPIFIWWLRNYLIYDNPIFPMLGSIFKGKYIGFLTFSNTYSHIYNYSLKGIFERFAPEILAQFLVVVPLAIVALYAMFKERKFEYVSLIAIFFLLGQFWAGTNGELRYYYPFLGIFLVYFLSGLGYIKSRKFLSMVFFAALFVLFSTPIVLSQSSFIGPVEVQIKPLSVLAEFIYNYRLIISIVLTAFFYFFLSKKENVKYLILLILCFYSVKTRSIQISWLNIWLPILGLVIIILGWNLLSKFKKENAHPRTVVALAGIVLFLNVWGLNIGYCSAHGRFPYPDVKGFTILPIAGEKIKAIEKENKDFYILTDQPRYLSWYFDYKEVDVSVSTFNYITKLKYKNTMSSEALRDLLVEAKIKYVIKSTTKSYWDYFFEKIENNPKLFKPMFEQNGYTLWRVI
ncbi:MAG: glycosyltransferase family 39 protein [Atribacterota bacterium]|nr:glycosyltransferase family 39 protein [Atribacterota bacterium]